MRSRPPGPQITAIACIAVARSLSIAIGATVEPIAVGIVYTLLVGLFVYREFDWQRAYPMLRETAALTGAIMLIIATATAMGWALTQSCFAQQLADALGHAGGPVGFRALSIVVFVVLGSVLEGISAMVLFGPLLFPIAAQYHINEVHYAIVAVLPMGIGLFSPPLGGRLLRRLRDRSGRCSPDRSRRQTDDAVSLGAARGAHRHRRRSVDFNWVFERLLRKPTLMPCSFIVATLCAAVLAGCSSSVPRLHQPDRIDAYCGDRAAIPTAIESIVASTGDVSEQAAVPSDERILKSVKDSGGIIAHWNDQPLYLPAIAKSVGADGDYVTLGDAAIGNNPAVADSRRIYLTLKTKRGPKTFALRAYDVQDVCNEGKLKS